jgi:two-component system, cell cycle sensor histidine kinase and response regulator CckA
VRLQNLLERLPFTARKVAAAVSPSAASDARAFVEYGAAGVAILDQGGIIRYISPAGLDILGRREDAVLGRSFTEMVSQQDLPRAMREFEGMLSSQPVSSRLSVRHAGGGTRLVEYVGHNHLKDPTIAGIVCAYADVTERVARPQPRPDSEDLFRAVFSSASDAILIADDAGRYVAANRAAGMLLGLPPSDIVGHHVSRFMPPGIDHAAAWQALREIGRLSGLSRIVRSDGATRDVEYSAVADVRPGRHLSILRDVTDRVRAESALREAEARLRGILDSNVVNITFANDQGDIFDANDAFLEMVGYTRGDLRGRRLRWTDITPPEFAEINERAQEEVRRRGRCAPFEKQYQRPDGSRVWVLISLARLPSARDHVISISTDITARKQIEQALIDSEHKFSTIFSNSPLALYLSELTSGEVIEANPAFSRLTGLSREELVGHTTLEFGFWPDTELRASVIGTLRAGIGVTNLETTLMAKDGAIRHVLVSAHKLVLKTDPRELVLVALNDVTEYHTLREQFYQAQKMEAMGQLAGGVAHDFSNLLTAIIGYSDLIVATPDAPAPVLADASQIQRAGRSAAALTHQLLAFSRRQPMQPKVIDVNDIVAHVGGIVRRLVGEHVEIVTTLARPLPAVVADPAQIEQVLINLVVNARDAMPSGGTLTIATGESWVDETYVEQHGGARQGRHVVLAVSDTGAGMDEHVRSHLFEPFFTTKELGSGTGLGLATVDAIVRQSAGHVRVQSALGVGSTFQVFLPATDTAAESAAASIPTRLTGSETILVVEDQAEVRALARDALMRSGYTVLAAASSTEAVNLMTDTAVHVDLLLTDVVMRQMNGRELARVLTASRPSLRVLYMSGYTEEALVRQGVLEPGPQFVQKPLSVRGLLARVREVLDADAQPPLPPP